MRRGATWLAVLGIVLGSITGAISYQKAACACDCAPITRAEAAAEADAVFIGIPERTLGPIDPDSPEPVTYEFVVQSTLKGPRHPSVRVQTSPSPAACGIDFQIGARYAVYAINSEGVLFAMICGGTYRLAAADHGPAPATTPSVSASPALSATPSARHAETRRPTPAVALAPAALLVPASPSEEDPRMPVEGVIAAVVIICVLLVAIFLVSRRRD